MNDSVEAGPAFKYLSSGSTRSGLSLDLLVYRTLLCDNDEGEGPATDPRSILRMRLEREEVPLAASGIEGTKASGF